MASKLKVATRGSKLALLQTQIAMNGLEHELIIVKTLADRFLDRNISQFGGKGVFVKELEEKVLSGEVDVAVHSAKDVPARIHPDLMLLPVARQTNKDVLYPKLDLSKFNGVIGTSSLRRKIQINLLNPLVSIKDIRGNIDTRIKKVGNGYDAVILSEAGILRMGIKIDYEILPIIPAATQGFIVIEFLKKRDDIIKTFSGVDEKTKIEFFVERSFLEYINADCRTATGCEASLNGEKISVRAFTYFEKFKSVEFEINKNDLNSIFSFFEKLV